ncbi:hypothetical protein SAMN04488029_2884 [Reichenbachiella faecimaris]|uniref:Uncharacterized protein n=1 Tax=Reichenbachiella faecimaris TaxID=692418 RepID=A0A1W2GIB8_REIFA|nr:hypothetical protein [Reichenbachiella faecimaris]SMD36409.1 hypothetical protein SAMN04488029_2884 [Reichenbachiella faecimaris]
MSRKTKSELTFILKLSLLFLILLASKVNRSSDMLTAAKQALSPKDSISVITASIRD